VLTLHRSWEENFNYPTAGEHQLRETATEKMTTHLVLTLTNDQRKIHHSYQDRSLPDIGRRGWNSTK
jgi:hypothetical protein